MHYLGLWENKGTEKGALKQYSENAVFCRTGKCRTEFGIKTGPENRPTGPDHNS